jgi:glutathione S-transferase
VIGLATHRWLLSPIDRPHLDALLGYYQRLSVRPAFRAHVSADVP